MKKFLLSLVFIFVLVGCGNSGAGSSNDFTKLSTADFNKVKESSTLVDARHNNYYNGWKDEKAKANGHFKKALDFSANWVDTLDSADDDTKDYVTKRLTAEVSEKGLDKAEAIVVYSSNLEEAQKVADYLVAQKVDVKKISLYEMDGSHKSNDFETVKEYQKLVSPKFINDLVTTGKAENYSNSKYQLFEVSWGDTTGSYDKGHIEKSVHINTDEFEHAPLWSLDSDKDLEKYGKLYGIDNDATLIFYGEDQMAAYRAAIIAEYMGAKDVRVLNGGVSTYTDAGYELSKEATPAKSDNSQSYDFAGKKLIDTYDDIKKKMSKDWQLIDARTKAEHDGDISGYDDLKYKGTIPGSIYHGAKWNETPGDVRDYINVDGTMRNITDVVKMLTGAGIDVNKHMSFYCGSGWRVAQILFYMQINGYEDTSMYSNGWYEYSDKNK